MGSRSLGNNIGRRLRGPVALVGSQLLGQLALVAVIPVLTRVYLPAELGIYQFAFAIAFIALPLATLRLEYIVPTTHSAALVQRRLRLGTIVVLGISVLVLATGVIDKLNGLTEVADILLMAGLLIPALGLPLLDSARLVRLGARRALAVRNLVGGVAGASLQAVFALGGGDVMLLPVALLLGRILGIIASRMVDDPGAPTSALAVTTAGGQTADARDERYTLARAIPTIGAGALSGLTIQGLTVIAGATVGPAAAGQVGIAQRVSSTPISLVGQALAQTTQLSFSRIIREQRPALTASLAVHVKVFLVLGVALGIALAIGGPLLAVPVLGPEWAPAGTLIAILAVPAALQVAVSPTDFLFVMLRRERRLLALQASRATLTWTAGLVTAAVTSDLALVVLAFSIAWAVAYVMSLVFVFAAARSFDREHADADRGAAAPAVIFASMTGDYPNIGDAIIRREALEWVSGLGPVHTYVGRAPDAWIDQIGAAELGPVYHRGAGSKEWMRALVVAKRPVLLFEPGEVQLESRHAVRELVFLAVIVLVKVKRGTVVSAPRAVARPGVLPLLLFRLGARAADVVPMRNRESLALVGGSIRSPDIAFGREGIPTGQAGPRDTLVVSLRGKRRAPSAEWIEAVRSFAEARGLRIVAAAQVRDDEDRAAELARALGAEDFGWGAIPELSQEHRLMMLYARARLVISDRLHVLVLATIQGAKPLELVDAPSGKVDSHFSWVGIDDVSVDSTGMDVAALTSALAAAAGRPAPPLTQALDRARADVAEVRRLARGRIKAVLARTTTAREFADR